jgi:RHS repeat-associated protein
MLGGFWRNKLGAARLCRGLVFGVIMVVLLSCWFGASQVVASVPTTAIRYTYTPDSQLSAVIKPEAEYGLYTWDAAGNLSSIAKKSSTKLSIIQLEPSKGAVGETVDIWGTGFSSTPSSDTVKFHGTAATVSTASAYELAVKVPSGATTGTVTVQTTTEGPVTSSQTFTVTSAVGAPTITSLSTSVVEAGSTVTVSGTNFEPTAGDDVVRVNQTDAEVVSASSTSIKFKVPSVTSGGHVVVLTPQGLATGPDLYIPPESSIATAKVGATEQIPSGKSVTIKLSTAETVGLVLFEATAGQHLAVVASEDTIHSGRISIFGPQDVELANSGYGLSESEASVDRLIAPTTGMYTVLVKPESTYTGSVTLSTVPAVTGVITPTAEGATQAVSITVPYEQGAYTVAGTEGEEVSLKVSEFTSFSKSVYLTWFNPEGKWMGEKGFTGNGFMETVRFPTTGAYTLVVNPNGVNTGSLKLTAYNATAVTGSITPTSGGESKTVTTTVPGQSANIAFSGNSGEEISLVLSESTFLSGKVSVQTSEGTTVAESTFGTSGTMVRETGAFTLPKTGTYTIHISAWRNEEETGSVKLTAYKVSEVTGSLSPTTGGMSENVSLPTPGQKAKYSVSGTAGEEVSLKVSEFASFSKSVYLTWFNTEGTWMKETGYTGNGFMESVVFPATGTYTLVVNPYGLNTGSLKVTAYSAVTGSIKPTSGGESKTVTTNGPGQNAKITFSGKSSEEVSMVLSESTIKSGHVAIENPEGSVVGEEKSFGSSGETTVGPVSLSSTGTYTIFIKPEGEYSGSVKLTAYIGKPPHGMVIRGPAGKDMPASSATPAGGPVGVAALAPAPGAEGPVFPGLTSALERKAPEHGAGRTRGRELRPTVGVGTAALTAPRSRGRANEQRDAGAGRPRWASDWDRREAGFHGTGSAATGGSVVLALPRAVRSFDPSGSGAWSPYVHNGRVNWSIEGPVGPWANLAALEPAVGSETALAGQALKLNGLPLAGLHVAVVGTYAGAVTDSSGRFLITGLPAGHQVLVVEGGTVAGQRYGTFAMGVQLAAEKDTTLDAPIWMTPLDPAGDRTVASPTRRETRITTPQIPGLEVRLPAGTVIHDAAGKVVRQLNITAIPVDRPPFPLPFFSEVPIYFTVQPGRAYLSKGAQIVYPNYAHLRPGARVDFWNYDPTGRGWYIYGQGTVTPNGKQVVPDPGVRVWEFAGAMITKTPKPPHPSPKPGGSTNGGDPVDLGTGLMVYRRTDLVIPDTIPIVIERTYRPGDSNSYSFGVGTSSIYDLRLWSENNYHEADLVLPDGGTVLYKRVSAGEGYTEAEYKATETPSVFYGSTIKWDPSATGWELTLTNGTTYIFGELAPLEAIRNKQGQQLTITRSEGQHGNITQITSPHGRWVKFTYNSSNAITELKDNTGRTLKYAYNKEGLLESATDTASRTTKYEYNAEGDMTSITDPRGNKYLETTYSGGLVSKQTIANSGTYEFSYALKEGNVESTTVTEPRGNKRKVTFNTEGYPTSETAGLGSSVEQTTSFERQAGTGLLLSSTDARSRKTAYEYNSYGNVTAVTRLAGTSSAQTYKYAYEPGTAELTKETDPLGHATTYEYNSLGELTASKDALGHTTHYEYNSDGQPTVTTNPLGKKTTITYENGAPTALTDPLGRTTKQFIDAAGQVLAITLPGGQKTAYEYNNDNQVTKMTDPIGNATTYEYDADGDLTAVTDPLKNKTTYAYTKMDLLESETDALTKKTTAVYDTEGNLTELTDRRGKLDKFTYDALNRLTEAKYGVSGETAESTIKYEYDNGNRLTKIIDSTNGTYTPEYDELNRLKSIATPQGTIKYEYDEANRRTSMTVPGQEALKYTYDEANRLKEIKRGTQAVTFVYNEDNLPTTTTLPDGIEEVYGYDEANEPTSIAYKKGGTTLGELDYSYDLDGREEAIWGSYARTGLPEAFSSAKYNADNEQTERGSKKLSYDADGHLTSDGTNEYTWNARGQLTGITGGTKASFSYSPFGQRVSRTLNGTTTEMLYDGPNVVQESQSGKVTANLLTGLMPSKVFARTTSKATENLLTDRLGSTIALASSGGSVETTYTYDPFGATTKEGTASENTMQYAGQENDGDGLYYDRARYYSSAAARFISQDPLGQAEGPNLYEYTGDSPLDATDPMGTEYNSLETAPKGECEKEQEIYAGTGEEPAGSCAPAEVPRSVETGLCELGTTFIPTPGGPVTKIIAGEVAQGVCERVLPPEKHESSGGGGHSGPGHGGGAGGGVKGKGAGLR